MIENDIKFKRIILFHWKSKSGYFNGCWLVSCQTLSLKKKTDIEVDTGTDIRVFAFFSHRMKR
jgi:hypothetical protein